MEIIKQILFFTQYYAWIILPLAYWVIALVLGRDRGYLRHLQMANNDYKIDLHPLHATLNIALWAIGVLILGNFFQPTFLLFTFSFWHDGMMYLTREKLSPGIYPKRFFDFTKTPIAFTDKLFGNTGSRVFLAVFGFICYLGFQFYYA